MTTRRLGLGPLLKAVVLGAAVVGAAALAPVAADAASAHQTASNNGVAVTVHVLQDDEPVVGEPSQVIVTRVKPKPKSGVFAWKTCRCALVVTDSEGEVLFKNTDPLTPATPMVFPEAGAYQITFSGRVRNPVKAKVPWRPFKVSFAIRASSPETG